ncbi:MAG: ATP-binding protein [Ginsengibacter sp.]
MRSKEEIVFTIIIVIVILVFLAIMFLVALARHNQRRNTLVFENQQIKKDFEQTLLNTRLEIQEQTLNHISTEIHDNIGQVLSLARLQLNTLSTNPGEKDIDYTDNLLEKAITDLRSLSHSLNTNSIKEKGFTPSVLKLLEQFEKTGKFKTFFYDEINFDISDDQGIILFRIIQEVLNNIVKHAQATEIQIRIEEIEGKKIISIIDNGSGFDTKKIESINQGIGIKNITSRALVIGAKLSLFSQLNQGTTVRIIFKNE